MIIKYKHKLGGQVYTFDKLKKHPLKFCQMCRPDPIGEEEDCMKKTGIFFHELCREKDIDWLLKGRLCNFPHLLEEEQLLAETNILLRESPATPLELLETVHSTKMIGEVKQTLYYETALHSSGGTVEASVCIAQGEMDNAFVFTGSADHHAARENGMLS